MITGVKTREEQLLTLVRMRLNLARDEVRRTRSATGGNASLDYIGRMLDGIDSDLSELELSQ